MAKTMQKATGVVRVGGSLLHTVTKTGITPGELVILKHLHGPDAVTQLELDRADFTDSYDEWGRLEKRYGATVMRELFPGPVREVPSQFSDVGIKINMETRRTRKAREMAEIEDDSPIDGEEEIDMSEFLGEGAEEQF